MEAPPTEEQLAFSKEESPADELVGCSILYNWPVVGWSAVDHYLLLTTCESYYLLLATCYLLLTTFTFYYLLLATYYLLLTTYYLLVSYYLLIGRCEGKIVRRNKDGHFFKKIDEKREKVNFFVFYDIDGEEIKTVLRLNEYGGDDDGAWVMLAAVEGCGGDGVGADSEV